MPYVTHVFRVELFFQIALATNLISSERPSNRADIAYLFYLPFCSLFVSSDKLHKKCAPYFLLDDQQFIWGPDLKSGLHDVNMHYLRYPEKVKHQGIMKFARHPPMEGDFFISKLYDTYTPGWRKKSKVWRNNEDSKQGTLAADLSKLIDAPRLQSDEIDFDVQNPDCLAVGRSVRKKKGSWFQLPKDLKVNKYPSARSES